MNNCLETRVWFQRSQIIELNQIRCTREKLNPKHYAVYQIMNSFSSVSCLCLIFGSTVSWSCSVLNVFLTILHKPPIHRFIISLLFYQFWGILISYAKVSLLNVSINVFEIGTWKYSCKSLYKKFEDQQKGEACK